MYFACLRQHSSHAPFFHIPCKKSPIKVTAIRERKVPRVAHKATSTGLTVGDAVGTDVGGVGDCVGVEVVGVVVGVDVVGVFVGKEVGAFVGGKVGADVVASQKQKIKIKTKTRKRVTPFIFVSIVKEFFVCLVFVYLLALKQQITERRINR